LTNARLIADYLCCTGLRFDLRASILFDALALAVPFHFAGTYSYGAALRNGLKPNGSGQASLPRASVNGSRSPAEPVD
jgi:hypothetical protein